MTDILASIAIQQTAAKAGQATNNKKLNDDRQMLADITPASSTSLSRTATLLNKALLDDDNNNISAFVNDADAVKAASIGEELLKNNQIFSLLSSNQAGQIGRVVG